VAARFHAPNGRGGRRRPAGAAPAQRLAPLAWVAYFTTGGSVSVGPCFQSAAGLRVAPPGRSYSAPAGSGSLSMNDPRS